MYKRVLLKLSGEALAGNEKNFDPSILQNLALEIKEAQKLGIQIAIVVGGGNFIRGKVVEGLGMLWQYNHLLKVLVLIQE